ncbi:MAG: hypothetical protein DRO88_13820 [Promethearchaeia archaeon]|nr:MAG: hypothetical protein DRO88_13820 [Candidatus Lokiarchaeia archaeon]
MTGFATAAIKKDHKIKFEKSEEDIKQLEKIEEKDVLTQSEKEQLLSELIVLLIHEKEEGNILSSIINCKKIIKLARDLKKPDLIEKYSNFLNRYEKKLEDLHLEEDTKCKSIQNQIEKYKEFIDIEENIAPEIENIPIEDLIGNINDDLVNMKDLANQVLEEHRVEIKESVKNRTIIHKKSGKAKEIHQDLEIKFEFDDSVNYIVTNTIDNTLDDPIEEAFIQDIIPYNYEILEVTLNGKPPKVESNQRKLNEGLEYSWYIPKIAKDEGIEFQYHLKPRISRTIVLPLKDRLTVIKTHSNLKEGKGKNHKIRKNKKAKKMDESGIFDAFLKFVNSFETVLNDVVLEDIIPIFYTYEVEERKTKDFPSIKESSESFVKWKLNEMPRKQSSIAEYQLIELNRIEEIKFEAYKLLQQDASKLSFFKKRFLKKRQKRAREFLKKMGFE